jgi:spore germination protein GerM
MKYVTVLKEMHYSWQNLAPLNFYKNQHQEIVLKRFPGTTKNFPSRPNKNYWLNLHAKADERTCGRYVRSQLTSSTATNIVMAEGQPDDAGHSTLNTVTYILKHNQHFKFVHQTIKRGCDKIHYPLSTQSWKYQLTKEFQIFRQQ